MLQLALTLRRPEEVTLDGLLVGRTQRAFKVFFDYLIFNEAEIFEELGTGQHEFVYAVDRFRGGIQTAQEIVANRHIIGERIFHFLIEALPTEILGKTLHANANAVVQLDANPIGQDAHLVEAAVLVSEVPADLNFLRALKPVVFGNERAFATRSRAQTGFQALFFAVGEIAAEFDRCREPFGVKAGARMFAAIFEPNPPGDAATKGHDIGIFGGIVMDDNGDAIKGTVSEVV